MVRDSAWIPPRQTMSDAHVRRWDEILHNITELLPAGPTRVLVDGEDEQSLIFAERLAAALRVAGRACVRTPHAGPPADQDAGCPGAEAVTLTCGTHERAHSPHNRWDVVIELRAPHACNGSQQTPEADADIVVDLRDPAWPLVRHVAARLAGRSRWYITESRAFFAVRAESWDRKFGDDLPAYAAAITEAGIPPEGVVLDVGCGNGRALPALRQVVGPRGAVIALDLTPEMLDQARVTGRAEHAALVLADACHLPLAAASVDAVFAAGLIPHLPDPVAGLGELARVTRPGGVLVLFHPSGRRALAARHGRPLLPDESLAEDRLHRSMRHTGWQLTCYDDSPHRFLATGVRR